MSSNAPTRTIVVLKGARASQWQMPLMLRKGLPIALYCHCVTLSAAAIDVRGAARPYLGLPEHAVMARPEPWSTEPAFPNVGFRNPVFLEPEPGADRLFVGELEGRIYAIAGSDHDTRDRRLVLDISKHTQGGWDCGLLGIAFHPQYNRAGSPNRGYIYLWYSWVEKPVAQGRPPPDKVTWTQLSRFTVDAATGTADPGSERVLMKQRDRYIIHAGGGMFFHPRDGFLYISVGDEGILAAADNVQRIDRNLFSGVLRIDVDQRGGDISHPIRTPPQDGVTAHYFIPNDNPFVGIPGALEEFFALGLRNPHRMTYDSVDDLAWIGDVGLTAMEEVSGLEFDRRPLNFQWSYREGTVAGPGAAEWPAPLGISADPIFAYDRHEGRSIIGGYVYRGRRLPRLRGKYIFGDFASGRIWALSYRYTKGAPPWLGGVELLAKTADTGYNYRGGTGGLTSFGVDHDGELYLLHHGNYTRIDRLVWAPPQKGNIPVLLSQTGAFHDTRTLAPAPGLLPYSVNVPQWSGGIPARHWISVPPGEQIRFSPEGPWRFPPGTVFVQHFELPAGLAASDVPRRLETRLLVVGANDTCYAVGYRWRPDQQDAELVTADGSQRFEVQSDDAERTARTWAFSSPQTCLECHTEGAGRVLGVKTRQIARELADETTRRGDDQLRAWHRLGLFDFDAGMAFQAAASRLSPAGDSTATVEHRVRSYLDVNCAHCHGSSPVRAIWDGKISTPLPAQHIVLGPVVGGYAEPGRFVIAPKDPAASELYRRVSSHDLSERMPPVGPAGPDSEFVALLRRWIEELPIRPAN